MGKLIRTYLDYLVCIISNKFLLFYVLPFFVLSCNKSETGPNPPVNLTVYKDSVFTKYFKRTSGWVAGDGAHSIPSPSLTVSGYLFLPEKQGIAFGKGVVVDNTTGFVYVYGTKPNTLGNDLFVARFPKSNIYNSWEFYNSSGWSTNASTSKKIYSEFTSSFNVCKIKNKFVLITTEFSTGCDQGKNIYTQTADDPYGPFINRKTIWQVNDLLQGHYPFFYLANSHPEYDNGKNELLVTYCINGYGTCVNTCVGNRKNPDVYRPKAIRIPYKLIDNDL